MKRTALSRRRKHDPEHAAATALAGRSRCMVCGETPCEPCHWPRHRGSGGRFANEWAPEHWVPLCRFHHDLIDGRLGVSERIELQREPALSLIANLAPRWWAMMKAREDSCTGT